MYLRRLFQCPFLRISANCRPNTLSLVASNRFSGCRANFTTQGDKFPHPAVQFVSSKRHVLSPPFTWIPRKQYGVLSGRFTSQVRNSKKSRRRVIGTTGRLTGKSRKFVVRRIGVTTPRKSKSVKKNRRSRVRKVTIRRRPVRKSSAVKRHSLKVSSRLSRSSPRSKKNVKRETRKYKGKRGVRMQKRSPRVLTSRRRSRGSVSRRRINRPLQRARLYARRLKRSFSSDAECLRWYQELKATKAKASNKRNTEKALRQLERLEARTKVGLLAARRVLRRHRSQIPVEVLSLRGKSVLAPYNELISRLADARDLKTAKKLLAKAKSPQLSSDVASDSEILQWFRNRKLARLRRRAAAAHQKKWIRWSPEGAPDRLLLLWAKHNSAVGAAPRSRAVINRIVSSGSK